MRNRVAGSALLFAGALAGGQAVSQTTQRFDGNWAVVLTCPAAEDGALGYTYRFPAQVRGGQLRGQNGTEGSMGYLVLQGPIQADGTALLTANGVTGNPDYSVRRVRQLSPYSYQVRARFDANRGTGTRIEIRACTLEFTKG